MHGFQWFSWIKNTEHRSAIIYNRNNFKRLESIQEMHHRDFNRFRLNKKKKLVSNFTLIFLFFTVFFFLAEPALEPRFPNTSHNVTGIILGTSGPYRSVTAIVLKIVRRSQRYYFTRSVRRWRRMITVNGYGRKDYLCSIQSIARNYINNISIRRKSRLYMYVCMYVV